VSYRFIIINFIILIVLSCAIGKDSRGKKSDFCQQMDTDLRFDLVEVRDTGAVNCFCKLVKDRPSLWFYVDDINALKKNNSIPCINSVKVKEQCSEFEKIELRNRAILNWNDSFFEVLIYDGNDYREGIMSVDFTDSLRACDFHSLGFIRFE
jgi:hypothetical protein